MAIAFDASSNSGAQTGSSYSFSHTTTGTGRLLFVGVAQTDANVNVDSVTYNGVAMTKITTATQLLLTEATIFYLVAPTSGTNTVAVTLSGAADSVAGAVSLTGVTQLNPLTDSSQNNSNYSASYS